MAGMEQGDVQAAMHGANSTAMLLDIVNLSSPSSSLKADLIESLIAIDRNETGYSRFNARDRGQVLLNDLLRAQFLVLKVRLDRSDNRCL